MLKINPDPQFTEDVELTIPGQNKPGSLSITFKYKNSEEYDDFQKRTAEASDADSLEEIIVKWHGLDAEYDRKNLETFIKNYPAAAYEIMVAYVTLLRGSRVKN